MKLKWIILAVIAVFLAVVIGLPIYAHYRLKKRVANYRAELRRQGEKITIAEIIPPAPTNGPNGAFQLITTVGQLPRENSFLTEVLPMRGLPPGRAQVAWQQSVLLRNKTNLWPILSSAVESNQLVLAEIRGALSNPVVRFTINYSAGYAARLSHLAPVKATAQWLSAATVYELHQGRIENAQENLISLISTTKALKDERFLICHMVRMAVAQSAASATWEALQHPGFQESHLVSWQKAWQEVESYDQAELALGMELAMTEQIFSDARKNPNAMGIGSSGSGNSLEELKENLYIRFLWPVWFSYEDEYRSLRYTQGGMEAARIAKTNAVWLAAFRHYCNIRDAVKKECPSQPLMPYFGDSESTQNILGTTAKLEATRRLVITAIALRRFHLQQGRYPERLQELVPRFLREAPRDFMDGQPLRYRLNADGSYLLYSIGEDGIDSGGDGSISGDSAARHWQRGKDWVWPRPATAEENKADEATRKR